MLCKVKFHGHLSTLATSLERLEYPPVKRFSFRFRSLAVSHLQQSPVNVTLLDDFSKTTMSRQFSR